MLLAAGPALAQGCPFAGQSPLLMVQMFFGQTVGRHAIAAGAWQAFLADTVTPRLPNGFTVYDANGQWRDPRTGRIGRERTKVIEVAAPDSPGLRAAVEAIAAAYRSRFHQQSVGILTGPACGAF
jgi:hypothetical protein